MSWQQIVGLGLVVLITILVFILIVTLTKQGDKRETTKTKHGGEPIPKGGFRADTATQKLRENHHLLFFVAPVCLVLAILLVYLSRRGESAGANPSTCPNGYKDGLVELRKVMTPWSVDVALRSDLATRHPDHPVGYRAPLCGTKLLHLDRQRLKHLQRENCTTDTIYFECWWENHKNGALSYFPNGGRFAWLPGTDFPYQMVVAGTTHLEGWVIRDKDSDGSATLLARI